MPRRTEVGSRAGPFPGAGGARGARGRPLAVLLWLVPVAAATALLWVFRGDLEKAHMPLVYLLVVLAASSREGRTVGLITAVVAFFCFNFFLLPPYYTLTVADPFDWSILFTFLITAAGAAELLARAQRQTRAAEQRAEEIDRLSALGAETLNAGRGEQGVQAIAEVIRETLAIGSCGIFASGERDFAPLGAAVLPGFDERAATALDGLFPYVEERGTVAVCHADGTTSVEDEPAGALGQVLGRHSRCRAFVFPLRVRERTVGLLRLADADTIELDEAQRRFLEVLAYYAALGVERVRLLAAAERIEVLREADRLKDALIAAVSHDLRTPLTTIRALAHEMQQDGDERAAIVVEETERLDRFVSDLLDLSRLNSGGMPMRIELTPVDDLVSAAIQQTAGALAEHPLNAALPPGEILVGRFDPVHAMRALTNLLQNAARYSPPGSAIDLNVTREGDLLLFVVEDRGPGIPETERERVFEPFYQIRRTSDGSGAGLGLSIARRLAEAQGGSLSYTPRPDGGSRFTLALPAADLPNLGELSA